MGKAKYPTLFVFSKQEANQVLNSDGTSYKA